MSSATHFPSISVVIPCYNGSDHVGETIESVLAQTLRPRSIVVVDNCSTDNTYEVVSRYSGVSYIKLDVNRGPADARNHGYAVTREEYIAFLDHDDLWHPNHLNLLGSLIVASNDSPPLVLSSALGFRDGEKPRFDAEKKGLNYLEPWKLFPAHGFMCFPAFCLFNRKYIDSLGGWNKEHAGISDYSIFMQCAVSRPIPQLRAVTAAHREHANSLTNALLENPESYIEFCMKVDRDLIGFYDRADTVSVFDKLCVCKRYEISESLSKLIYGNQFQGMSDDQLVADVALQLDTTSNDFRIAILKHYFDLLSSHVKQTDLFFRLLNKWPATSESKNALASVIQEYSPGLRFYFKYVLKRFWRASALMFVIKMLCGKIRR